MTMTGVWNQDRSDYSWSCRDADGTLYRVSQVLVGDISWMWVLAWQESSGLRIGSKAFDTADEAKERAESIFAVAA